MARQPEPGPSWSQDEDAGSGLSGQDNAARLPGRSEPSARPNPLASKLNRLVHLNLDEVDAIAALTDSGVEMRGEQVLYRRGEPPDEAFLIKQGMGFRYKMLANGRRQILGYLIPGDLCGSHRSASLQPDHDVILLEHARAVRIDRPAISDVIERFPAIGEGIALAALADRAILREWLLTVGQRNSIQRLGHFLCEMAFRMGAIGEIDADGSFALPLSQAALADTIGLTPVHINRTLQRLRSSGLISLRQGRLNIIDREGLAELAEFDENYLDVVRCRDR